MLNVLRLPRRGLGNESLFSLRYGDYPALLKVAFQFRWYCQNNLDRHTGLPLRNLEPNHLNRNATDELALLDFML